ncbi:MAG: DMP19 family protein, partial [Gemmatimonadota bacterium]|nr:DMP19 family protein [Gemmatimonadota bacterium]
MRPAWLAIEKIYDELKLPYRPDNRFNELTDGQRAVYVLHWVQSEIRNGGFEQLCFNSTGRFAALAPAAARQVGADDYAAVFARANSLFADDGVPEQAGRRRQALRDVLDERRDELDAIENDFFTLLGQTDIYDHLG